MGFGGALLVGFGPRSPGFDALFLRFFTRVCHSKNSLGVGKRMEDKDNISHAALIGLISTTVLGRKITRPVRIFSSKT